MVQNLRKALISSCFVFIDTLWLNIYLYLQVEEQER